MSGADQKRLAVFVDADNLSAKHAPALFASIAEIGAPVLRRIYADWSRPTAAGWLEVLPEFGLRACQATAHGSGKNASDIAMVIDAMDVLRDGGIDGFVLVSSDSDFTALAHRIREATLPVTGIGEAKASKAFANACTRFVRLAAEPKPHPAPATPRQPCLNHPYQLILNALKEKGDPESWTSLSSVGKSLRQKYPGFDPRGFGHPKLKDLVSAIDRLELCGEGSALKLRQRADQAP